MKKGLLTVLMTVVMTIPAFAAKGDMSIDAKLGLGVSNSIKMIVEDDYKLGFDVKNPFSLGAEFFYGLSDILSLGVGANYIFNSETDGYFDDLKVGTTNLYVAVKPEFKIESNVFSNIYLIGQIGLAINRIDWENRSVSVDNGLYLGAGFGTTIKDAFFVELVLSSSNGHAKRNNGGSSADIQYTATTINVGYRFSL
ncbi:MAG: outer membrane beta-barrel protein [Elusimicrobia bacterium]|nr:outer membrane beta-barrel protein [Elusimicrobiota bacterium]